jgi:hypothetical protein
LRSQIRDRRSDVRDHVRHEVQSAVIDLKDALRTLKQ